MFETPLSVAVALRRYGDLFDPRTGSVIGVPRNAWDPAGDPFRAGFLGGVEERAELVRRMMSRLQPRERLLLVLWYVSDQQATVIARQLQVSRVHCYRLRDKALRALCDTPDASYAPHASHVSGSRGVGDERSAGEDRAEEAGNVRSLHSGRNGGSQVTVPFTPRAAG